ncbi:MAG: acyl carrier protein [Thermoguttaceae bacterium]
MGLDLVELSLEIESRYGVELRADDWASVETFGDLVDSVARRQGETREMLASRETFDAESVRSDILRVLGGPPEAMSRRERLAASMRLRKAFPEIQEQRLSCWATLLCASVFVATFLSSLVFVVTRDWRSILGDQHPVEFVTFMTASFLALGGSGLVAWCLTKTLSWLLTPTPRLAVDVIVEEILEYRRRLKEKIDSRPAELSSELLEEELRTFIATNFGFRDPQKITRASRLVRDLGLG